MKRKVLTVKEKIQKKIELRNKEVIFLNSKGSKKNISTMNERDRERIYGKPNRPSASGIDVKLLTNAERTNLRSIHKKDIGSNKPTILYDIIICVLNQLFSQKTNYSFKVIIMNDGSTEKKYDNLKKEFPDIIYLERKINGGRRSYWETTNTIFEELRKYSSYAVIQIDDDFILCNDFINILIDKFFELKAENNSYMGIKYHLASFNEVGDISKNVFDWKKTLQTLDGGSLFDPEFLKLFDYKLPNYHVWGQLYKYIREFGVMVYTFRESLAYHDGNFDSKMYPVGRINRKIYTKRFKNDSRNDI